MKHVLCGIGCVLMAASFTATEAQTKPAPAKPESKPAVTAPSMSAVKAPVKPTASKPAAVVNGVAISMDAARKAAQEWYLSGALEELISYTVIEQAAAQRKVTVPAAAIDARLNQQIQQASMGLPAGVTPQQALAERGYTIDRLRRRMRATLLLEEMVKRSLGDTQYVRASHILVRPKFPEPITDANLSDEERQKQLDAKRAQNEAEAEAKINNIAAEIKGGKPFADAAKEYSEDPGSKDQGGDLRWFARGQMVPEFDAAVFNPDAKEGEVIGPIKSQFGWHLIVITGKQIPADEKARLQENQVRQALGSFAQQLMQQAKITNNVAPVRAMPQQPMPPAPRPQTNPGR